MFRRSQLYAYLLLVAFGVAVATALSISSTAQSCGSGSSTFLTAIDKSGVELELRSDAKIMADEILSGQVILGPEEAPTQNVSLDTGKQPLRGPNTQVNDSTLDNAQIFAGFRPFLHFTQSETTVAAKGQDIVVSYNNSAGARLALNSNGAAFFTQLLLSGYSFSNDGGETWTSGFVPAAPGVGPFTFGAGVVAVDRRGNFYYASLGETANGHGSVTVNISKDGGRTFAPGVIAGVDDGSDKNWIAVGPDPKIPGRDNIYVTWTSFTNTGSRVAFAVSKDGGQTFQARIIFAPGPNSDPTKPQNAIQFTNPVVDPANGRLYIPFTHFSNSDKDFIRMLVSDDAGESFRFVNFNIPGASDPTLV